MKSIVPIFLLLQKLFITMALLNDLRSLGVRFPPHDSSDVGSNPAEVVEFLRTEKFREQILREGL
jgi:hypothetical protein